MTKTEREKLERVRATLREARARGEKERVSAPSRSTGLRRQFKTSHEALTGALADVEELLA